MRCYAHAISFGRHAARCNLLTRVSLMTDSTTSSTVAKNSKVATLDTINPCILNVHYAVRGPIVARASEIQKEIDQGVSTKLKRVIRANIGDCHVVGQIPITLYREVLAGCSFPELLKKSVFPDDVCRRVNNLLAGFNGSIGCYTESLGADVVRKCVARYIEKRDGYPVDANNIVLTNGASGGVKTILYSLMRNYDGGKNTGVLVPVPQYPLYSATLSEFGGELISYYLDEQTNWGLDMEDCERALGASRDQCVPKAMVVINPGNPTGQVLTYQNMVDIVKFCKKHGLVLLADEVYQQNVHDSTRQWFSFKKVVRDCGFDESSFELVSFHSASKGFYGECGIRGGYMELFGIDPDFQAQLSKLLSAQLCSTSCGQVLMHCVVTPPEVGDPSYELFSQQKSKITSELKQKAEILHQELNSIPGITCNKIQGAMYAFPQLHLPEKLIAAANAKGMPADEFYCFNLLEQTGICVVPGSGFKQRDGTYHFRTTILPPVEQIVHMTTLLKGFHGNFIKQFT